MKCYKCGNDVDEGSIFCLCCGADLIDYNGVNNGKLPQGNEKTEYEVIASASGAEKTVRISENEANANKKSPYDPVKPDLGGQVFWQPSDDEKDKVEDVFVLPRIERCVFDAQSVKIEHFVEQAHKKYGFGSYYIKNLK